MAGIPCSYSACEFNTDMQVPPETSLENKLNLLKIHSDTVHQQQQQQVGPRSGVSNHKAKLNPPKLSAGSSIETWEHFLRAFGMYRTAMSIQEEQAQIFIFNCLDEEL